jgi:hypothetical protein
MKRRWMRLALTCGGAAILLIAGTATGSAQGPSTGAISGELRGESRQPLPNVLVTLREEATGMTWTGHSDLDGMYRFALLAPGEYEVTFERLSYAPRRVQGAALRAGQELRIDAVLALMEGPATTVATDRLEVAALAAGRAGDRVGAWAVAGLPHQRREAARVARLSPRADASLGLDGLPPWLTAVMVDGLPFRPAAHPLLRDAPLAANAFGLSGVRSADVLSEPADVEWTGAAGGWIGLHSQRGSAELELRSQGAWTGSVLPGPSFGDGLAYNDAQGAFQLRAGSGAGARVSAGLDVQRLETPFSPTWGDTPTAEALAGGGAIGGVDFAGLRRSSVSAVQTVAGSGRLDWPLGERNRIGASLHVAAQPKLVGSDPRVGTFQAMEGTDLVAGGTLVSAAEAFDLRLTNEARAALTVSSRTSAGLAAAAPTWIVSDGLALGGVTTPARGEEARLLLSNTLHVGGRRHRIKLGVGAEMATRRYDYRQQAEGEYFFADADDLLSRRGFVIRSTGPAFASEWRTVKPFVFVQERFQAAPGLELQLGARAERSSLPGDRVTLDNEWQQLSGLANNAAGGSSWTYDVRAGVTLDVLNGGAILFASGGTYTDEVDPLLLHQWQADAGAGRVRREFGTLSWPADPASGAGYRRVTMLAPGFAAPRSTRGSGGVAMRITGNTTALLSGTVRRTENLPRRVDLNLLPEPAMRDQYGRAVFGTLVKEGGLLMAQPSTGRRFSSYDEAAGVNADGWSNHWGLNLGIEHETVGGTGVLARYTFSRTRDNWFGARQGGWTAAPPRGLAGATEWAEGTSDFDAPHRLTAALLMPLPLPLSSRLSVVYRGESGLPFTPGFRRGVDASGDGYMDNDPAFIDVGLPGISELLGQWSCLAESRDTFAARNACRGPAAHRLDVGLAVDVLRWGRSVAAVSIDAFDIFEAARTVPDAALYIVDPANVLVTDAPANTVTVPLLVNAGFGQALVRPHAGRQLRLGVSVKW